MSQQAPIDERDVPGEQEAWHRLHDVIDRITPEAAYWVRKAGPEHYAEHLPRLEAWVDEVSRRPA